MALLVQTSRSEISNRAKLGPELGVERVGVLSAESGNFATFADGSCCVALSALVLALSAQIIQKVTINSALYLIQFVLLFLVLILLLMFQLLSA